MDCLEASNGPYTAPALQRRLRPPTQKLAGIDCLRIRNIVCTGNFKWSPDIPHPYISSSLSHWWPSACHGIDAPLIPPMRSQAMRHLTDGLIDRLGSWRLNVVLYHSVPRSCMHSKYPRGEQSRIVLRHVPRLCGNFLVLPCHVPQSVCPTQHLSGASPQCRTVVSGQSAQFVPRGRHEPHALQLCSAS